MKVRLGYLTNFKYSVLQWRKFKNSASLKQLFNKLLIRKKVLTNTRLTHYE